jgi:hypothetical protein
MLLTSILNEAGLGIPKPVEGEKALFYFHATSEKFLKAYHPQQRSADHNLRVNDACQDDSKIKQDLSRIVQLHPKSTRPCKKV